jgi:hypothetical protein
MLSCASTRKSVQTNSTDELFIQSNESQSVKVNKVIDTTKTENVKITITEIEFYPPTVTDERLNNESTKPSNNVSCISLLNIVNIDNAAIKSIKQTTIEADTEEKGESRESESNESEKSEAAISNSEKNTNSEVEPASDPYRWRYIFYILMIALIVLLYLKRVPILNWMKTSLSNVWRIF